MMRKLSLFVVMFLLLSAGMVAARSSPQYNTQRFVVVGGGAANSASFSVNSVIGQPTTDVVNSASYKVSGSFLYPIGKNSDFKVWLPVILK